MSLSSEILDELLNREFRYKGICVNLLGIPKFGLAKRNSFNRALGRLVKSGLIEHAEDNIVVTAKGRKHVEKLHNSLQQFKKPKNTLKARNLLIIFDIPEEYKGARDWLRQQFKRFNYIMIQKSVWVGPSPLPIDFVDYLKEKQLISFIKTFKLNKDYKHK